MSRRNLLLATTTTTPPTTRLQFPVYLEWDKIDSWGYAFRTSDQTSKLLFEHLSTAAQEYGSEFTETMWHMDEPLLNQLGIFVYLDGCKLKSFDYSTDTRWRNTGFFGEQKYVYMDPDGFMECDTWTDLGGGA